MMLLALPLALSLTFALTACTSPGADDSGGDGGGSSPAPLVVVTFNSGTTEGLDHDAEPDDGYTSEDAVVSDSWYGDGLAWKPAVEAATAFFAATDPDIVVFQEIFWSDECAEIPLDAHAGFVCEDWQAGDPTVAQVILGDGYQVACHPGKPDKCAAVHERVGRFAGCEEDFCLEGLAGSTVDGCGSGARVGRGEILGEDGALLTLVNVHGSSGAAADDQACRVQQIDQVFVDLGDGEPAVNGAHNLIMGDLNTDPGRWTEWDDSAARWADFVGDGLPFHFISESGEDAPRSYLGLSDIDHVMSDALAGDCWYAGLSDGHPAVIDAVYFDHRPVVCSIYLEQ